MTTGGHRLAWMATVVLAVIAMLDVRVTGQLQLWVELLPIAVAIFAVGTLVGAILNDAQRDDATHDDW
jgi:hypothetical protein